MSATADPRTSPPVGAAAVPAGPRGRSSPDPAAPRARLRTIAVVAAPTILAAALCLYEFTSRSLWLDESASVAIASQHGAALGSALAHDGGNMLGYYALLHLLIGAFGSGAFVIRLPSVLAATATVAEISVLAMRLFDRRVALGAGLIAAVSLPLVYWGQDARGYALMVALVAGSFLALLTLVESERPSRAAWLAYLVLTTAAVYAGLEAVLVVPAQLVVLLWHRDRVRAVSSALLVSAICCAPLAVLAANRGAAQLFWVPRPSLQTAKQIAQALASSGLQPSFYTSTGGALLDLTAALLLVAACKALLLLQNAERRAHGSGAALAWCWLVVPAVLVLIQSTVGQSIFQPRYLLVSLPAVALLLAWALLDRGVPRTLAFAGLAAVIALRALQLAPSYGVSPEPWRQATSHVIAQTRPGDCAAFYPADNRMPFKYYLRTPALAPRSVLPALPWAQTRPYVEDYDSLPRQQLSRLPAPCQRVWLVTSHEGEEGGPPISRANYARLVAMRGVLAREYPDTTTTTFGSARAITIELFARSG